MFSAEGGFLERDKLACSEFDLDSYQALPVKYELRYSILQKIEKGQDPLPDIQGREEAKRDVIRALLSGAHPYLVSEEGTGKTRLARSLTRLLPTACRIKGCPYNDDPTWPRYLLCPRCRESEDPIREIGVESIPGERRFSRIQGNEYTNEAKLLGLKDIQAIILGQSPSDPKVFTGTGVFRANRGILFIDELPAIRTKVQVLLHPILEEGKAILEEYNWEHPLDLILVATGNPQDFAHVNEVPRPLLDRLELIYMNLPEEEVERKIMLAEKFRVGDRHETAVKADSDSHPTVKDVERNVVAPWWIIDLVNKAVRHSRRCSWLDRGASIRASIKAMDHVYASVELENRRVANLRDACDGLKLGLRGRIGLKADFMDFQNPRESFRRSDEIAEDILWNALEDFDFPYDWDEGEVANEITWLFSEELGHITYALQRCGQLNKAVGWMQKAAQEKVEEGLNEAERELYANPASVDKGILEEYNHSALETVINIACHRGIISKSLISEIIDGEGVFVPKMVGWSRG
jgi:MoxR-like ATPase